MHVFRMAIAAVAALLAAGTTGAMAQATAGSTAYVVTYIEILPSAKGVAANLLKQIAVTSRKEPGNLRYDVLNRIDRDNQFAILEAWSDLKAAEAHAENGPMKQFRAMLQPLQSAPYDTRPSHAVAAASGPTNAGSGSVYVITHVDVTPQFTAECVAMLNKLADGTRKDENSERIEAWQQNNRANHFALTEIWKNRAAIDSHLTSPAVTEFREKLGPMIGALYDERFYTSIQ